VLESVCKHIFDEEGVAYPEKEDLLGLYWQAAGQVRLAPDQHTEQGIRRLLGNCQVIVQEMGILQNRRGDAHSRSKDDEKPHTRQAELAVNFADFPRGNMGRPESVSTASATTPAHQATVSPPTPRPRTPANWSTSARA